MDSLQPGRDVLDALTDSVTSLQVEFVRQQQLRAEYQNRIRNLLTEKQQALTDLAKLQLPDLTDDSIARTSRDIRDELEALAHRRARQRETLESQLLIVDAEIDGFEGELATVTKALDAAAQRREELERKVAENLNRDETFRELSQRVLRHEQQLTMFEHRVAEAKREAEEKLPAYQDSRLFQHLHRRQYGTADYAYRGITKMLDRWVARMIDYRRSRQSFDFLRSVPQLMADEVSQQRHNLDEAVASLETIELDHWRRVGLDEATREGDRLGGRRAEIVAALEPLLEQRNALQTELADAESEHGEHYQQAIEHYCEYLDSLAGEVLSRQAQRTPDAHDDHIVADVRMLRDELQETNTQHRRAKENSAEAQRHVKGLQYVIGRFRKSEFDAQRSKFSPSLDMTGLIHRYQDGEMNHIELWRSLRRAQDFDPTWVEQAAEGAAEAVGGETGQTLLSAAAHLAGSAIAVAVQNKLSGRGMVRDRPSRKGIPRLGQRYTKGPGF